MFCHVFNWKKTKDKEVKKSSYRYFLLVHNSIILFSYVSIFLLSLLIADNIAECYYWFLPLQSGDSPLFEDLYPDPRQYCTSIYLKIVKVTRMFYSLALRWVYSICTEHLFIVFAFTLLSLVTLHVFCKHVQGQIE